MPVGKGLALAKVLSRFIHGQVHGLVHGRVQGRVHGFIHGYAAVHSCWVGERRPARHEGGKRRWRTEFGAGQTVPRRAERCGRH